MNNAGSENWFQQVGAIRAWLLGIAIIGKMALYIIKPPFTPTEPLILPFPLLVTLELVWAAANGIIVLECLRAIFRSTSSWGPTTHIIVCGGLILLLVVSRFLFRSGTSSLYYTHGWSLADKGDYGPALLSLGIAVRYDPTNVHAYVERAFIYRKQGQYRASINDCNVVIELSPDKADGYECRGYTHYYQCNGQKALNDWGKAIALDQNSAARLEKWITTVKSPLFKC